MDISLITTIVLVVNVMIMLFAVLTLKNATDWLKALDGMMAGKSKKAKCSVCGRVYNRDTSHDICGMCNEYLKGYPSPNDMRQKMAEELRVGQLHQDITEWGVVNGKR